MDNLDWNVYVLNTPPQRRQASPLRFFVKGGSKGNPRDGQRRRRESQAEVGESESGRAEGASDKPLAVPGWAPARGHGGAVSTEGLVWRLEVVQVFGPGVARRKRCRTRYRQTWGGHPAGKRQGAPSLGNPPDLRGLCSAGPEKARGRHGPWSNGGGRPWPSCGAICRCGWKCPWRNHCR